MPISPEDRGSIMDLAARYCHSFDLGDPEGWVACFAEDGEFVTPAGETVTGHGALRAFVDCFQVPAGLPAPMRQMPTAIAIDGDGTRATMRYYFTAYILVNPPMMLAIGRFEDELQKSQGDWKFLRRREILDWTRFAVDADPETVLAALRQALD